ncbi:hypothetical protein TTHERM_00741640 (macronuclear) [Tetrahymena thermophila SB210]|uniref:Uncharacterized protein n=1 Tax=Tetrahymena thermophila (strain SB210) TaxID=312017 RepID=Q239W7_TETTS|nr:hypothetical protein TTHERM_00741640 [Tetrahymena thermophila SB210]EAR93291.2 hypothetical protein TTHERM_00741640 [Tetrahymena thermophila SB210]|eukprot:XP_001013536.2 hypothetical protein TTHERM_00741640 [Tetrahymena thermophila SB210]
MYCSCEIQTYFQTKIILPCQQNSIEEKKDYSQSITLCDSVKQSLSQKLDSIFSKMKADHRKISGYQSRKLILQSDQCSTLSDDSKTNINSHESYETFNSRNSFIIQSLIPISEIQNEDIKYQNIFNSAQSSQKINQTSIQSANSNQIYESNGTDLNQKEKNFFLDLPLDKSRCFFDDNEDENKNSFKDSTYLAIQQSGIHNVQKSLSKRVTFQDLIFQDKFQNCKENQSLLLQQSKLEAKFTNSVFRIQLQLDDSKKANKPILKKPQSLQFNTERKQQKKDTFQSCDLDMDYFKIKNEELILDLLDQEISKYAQQKKYFFSELVTKISKSGEKKQKIIFITLNCFYVLEDLYSHNHIQKCDICDINKIIIHSESSKICSIIVKNIFQLNLQIKHFNVFILFIQSIFKCVLETYLPIQQEWKQQRKEQAKTNKNKNTELVLTSPLNKYKIESYTQIQFKPSAHSKAQI